MTKNSKNYVYRMDHDTGFAPNTDFGICSLSGCKTTTVERWAEKGSWVIGIGGNGTHRPNKLIYAMEVDGNLLYREFKRQYPRKSRYLNKKPVRSVLVSRRFYYFGDTAVSLPKELQHIIIYRQGCRRVCDDDIAKLRKFLAARYQCGARGKPNNPQPRKCRSKCLCLN